MVEKKLVRLFNDSTYHDNLGISDIVSVAMAKMYRKIDESINLMDVNVCEMDIDYIVKSEADHIHLDRRLGLSDTHNKHKVKTHASIDDGKVKTIEYSDMENLNIGLLEKLLVSGASANNAYRGIVGKTLLMHVCGNRLGGFNRLSLIRLLLKHGASINAKFEENGTTALMLAVSSNDYDAVGLLLERGADINDVNSNGGTARKIAVDHEYDTIVELLTINGGSL